MRNSKNKKRLSGLVAVFMLTFLVGSAFAFIPGVLDIVSGVNLAAQDDLYVVWSNVTGGDDFQLLPSGITPAGGEFNATHTAQIVNERDRTAQRIIWTINFSEAGFADITATATNNSPQPAIITGGSASWSNVALGLSHTDFGLNEVTDFTGFVGETLAPGASVSTTIRVTWDGTIPAGFTVPTGETYAFSANLTVTFNYAPAA